MNFLLFLSLLSFNKRLDWPKGEIHSWRKNLSNFIVLLCKWKETKRLSKYIILEYVSKKLLFLPVIDLIVAAGFWNPSNNRMPNHFQSISRQTVGRNLFFYNYFPLKRLLDERVRLFVRTTFVKILSVCVENNGAQIVWADIIVLKHLQMAFETNLITASRNICDFFCF